MNPFDYDAAIIDGSVGEDSGDRPSEEGRHDRPALDPSPLFTFSLLKLPAVQIIGVDDTRTEIYSSPVKVNAPTRAGLGRLRDLNRNKYLARRKPSVFNGLKAKRVRNMCLCRNLHPLVFGDCALPVVYTAVKSMRFV